MKRPAENEYAAYYGGYINKVEGDDVISVLEEQEKNVIKLLESIPMEKENYSYSERKWSIKELVGHFIDTERVMAYRAMCIARNERQPLPGFEQDDFVKASNFNERNMESFSEEFTHLRKANIALFKSFNEEIVSRRGTASNYSVTVRALMFIIAGHTEHHLRILKEKYL